MLILIYSVSLTLFHFSFCDIYLLIFLLFFFFGPYTTYPKKWMQILTVFENRESAWRCFCDTSCNASFALNLLTRQSLIRSDTHQLFSCKNCTCTILKCFQTLSMLVTHFVRIRWSCVKNWLAFRKKVKATIKVFRPINEHLIHSMWPTLAFSLLTWC